MKLIGRLLVADHLLLIQIIKVIFTFLPGCVILLETDVN